MVRRFVKRISIQPAAGGGVHFPLAEKSIRLARYGCTNRPFYHIVVNMVRIFRPELICRLYIELLIK